MISEVLKDMPMDTDCESGWIPVNMNIPGRQGLTKKAKSLQITWKNATGTLDGTVEVQATSDPGAAAVGKTLTVSSESNDADSELMVLYPFFKYIKVKYTKNNITGGIINAVVSY